MVNKLNSYLVYHQFLKNNCSNNIPFGIKLLKDNGRFHSHYIYISVRFCLQVQNIAHFDVKFA